MKETQYGGTHLFFPVCCETNNAVMWLAA